jgi:hypothetical protein
VSEFIVEIRNETLARLKGPLNREVRCNSCKISLLFFERDMKAKLWARPRAYWVMMPLS